MKIGFDDDECFEEEVGEANLSRVSLGHLAFLEKKIWERMDS